MQALRPLALQAAQAHRRMGRPRSPFEQMEFAVQDGHQVFSSWLHDRPEVSGGLRTLTGCTSRVAAGRSSEGNWTLQLIALGPSRPTLRQDGKPESFTCRRIP